MSMLTFLDFLHQFKEKRGDTSSFDKTVNIINWEVQRVGSPAELTERREVFSELLSAVSYSKLNSVGEIQITCKNQIEYRVGSRKNLRVQREEERRELSQKMVREGEILTRLTSSNKRDDAIDRRLHDTVEGTKEGTIQSDTSVEDGRVLDSSKESAMAKSLTSSDRQRDQFSRAYEKALEGKNHWQMNYTGTQEEGVEISDVTQARKETNESTEETQKNRSQVVKDHDSGGGFSILGFISSRKREKKTTTEGQEEGTVSKEGTSSTSSSEQSAKLSQGKKQELQQATGGEESGKKSLSAQAEVGSERGKERTQDQKITVLSKEGLSKKTYLKDMEEVKTKNTKTQDNEEGSREVRTSEEQRSGQSSVKNSFNFEHARSFINVASEEYAEDTSLTKSDESNETFSLRQGYLLVSKVELMRRVVLTPVRYVLEMNYSLQPQGKTPHRVESLDENSLDPYLRPLFSRIRNVANRRFNIVLHNMTIIAGAPVVKNLALEVWNDDRASRDRANSLNIIFHRLGRYLENISDKTSQESWTKYHFHRDAYLEEASLKYCDDAARSLQGMFLAFQGEGAVCRSEQFLRLHSEFQGLVGGLTSSHRSIAPPDRDSGGLFYKEKNAKGLLLGQKQLTLQDSYKNLLVVRYCRLR